MNGPVGLNVPHICVFCGSSDRVKPDYLQAARSVGEAIARRGLGLVYGGGRSGLMGALADASLNAGGHVVGILPAPLLEREPPHPGLDELHVVANLAERKALMSLRASAFLALPGGTGMLEELSEVLNGLSLGLHNKPIALLDCQGFFTPLLAFLARADAEQFLHRDLSDLILVSSDLELCLERLTIRTNSQTVATPDSPATA